MVKPGYEYVDVHAHLYEYDDNTIREIVSRGDIIIVAVGDDFESSRRIVELSRTYSGSIVACVGLHPWSVKNLGESLKEALNITRLALENNIRCLGEVGLDTRFVPETIDVQREVFKIFLETARDHKLVLNIHAAGTWDEVYRLLLRYDIPYANLHWYTGPLNLLNDLAQNGYSISINPAVRIQEKHQKVVEVAPLEMLLTESDAPYEYRGIRMHPSMVASVVEEIARIKNMETRVVRETVRENFSRMWLRRL